MQDTSSGDPVPAEVNRNSLLAAIEQIVWLRPLLFGSLAICLLLSVALYNGYPTIFSDTGSYVLTGELLVAFSPFRSPGYSIFTRLTSLRTTAWLTIAMQAIIVLYVLHKTFAYLIGRERKFRDYALLASVCAMTALTSLPWLVSLLMPDVFAGILFLSAFLLAFDSQLRLSERIYLAAILMISVSAHVSFLPIGALFVAALVIPRLAGCRMRGVPPVRLMLAWLLVPIIAAGFWTANLNRQIGLGFKLSPSRNMFLLARLFEDGLAADFLHENCPKHPFVACRYLSTLPRSAEEFLFHHPLLQDITGHEDEMEAIVWGTLSAHPVRFVTSSIKSTLLQLAALRTGDEIRTYSAREWNTAAMQRVFPGEFQSFLHSRQFRGRLLPLVDTVAPVQAAIFWLSIAACLLLAWTGRVGRVNQFLYSTIAFLVINAAVCATLSGVYDRYQSRVAWIVPFCLTAYICCLFRERERAVVRQKLCTPVMSNG